MQPGEVVNNYEIIEQLGSGGFSTVYKVCSKKFGYIFAAKVITVDKLVADKAWESFDAEIQSLVRLDHPNIIRLYDHFRDGNRFFLILEYCEGGSLWDLVRKQGPLKGRHLIEVVLQICSAVSYAFERGIVHRDIKPQNILLDSFGRCKLADFGISHMRSDGARCRDYRCSACFAAPELLRHLPFDPMKADVWSLGVTIASLVLGAIPWADERSGLNGLYVLPPGTDPTLRKLIERMIVVNPSRRISMIEFEKTPFYQKLSLMTENESSDKQAAMSARKRRRSSLTIEQGQALQSGLARTKIAMCPSLLSFGASSLGSGTGGLHVPSFRSCSRLTLNSSRDNCK